MIEKYKECSEHEFHFALSTTRNGARRLVKQCLICGCKKSGSYKLNSVKDISKIPDFDNLKYDLEMKKREDFYNQYYKDLKKAKDDKQTEWWQMYSNYLKTEKWKNKRNAILLRDKYICQGCLRPNANEVHHLTYDNVTDELAFQLISLCSDCHNRVHEK